jgi:hypothetical protein
MKDSMEYWDPSGQAGLAYDRVTSSISILLIVTFVMISLLIWREFWILQSKKINQASENYGSDSIKPELQKTSEISDAQTAEDKKIRLTNFLNDEIRNKSLKADNLIAEKILSALAKVFEISQGEIFLAKDKSDKQNTYKLAATYAMHIPEKETIEFNTGEGLVGQVAKNGKSLYLDKLPDGFLKAKSGLGDSNPNYLLFIPWKDKNNRTFAVAELASFKNFDSQDIKILEGLSKQIYALLNP